MDRQTTIEYFQENPNGRCLEKFVTKNHPDLYNDILSNTPKTEKFSERIYLYFTKTKGVCKECGKETKFRNIRFGYSKYCSTKCSDRSKDRIANIENTILSRYGVKNASQSEEIKLKKKQTLSGHYGVEVPLQSEEIKSRASETTLSRYGVKNASQSEEIKLKKKQTLREHYGDENYINVEKIKQTKLERYGDKKFNNRSKYKQTCLDRFGVENASQSDDVKEKYKQTCLDRFGLETTLFLPQCIIKIDSKPNREFANLLEQHNILYEREFKIGNKSFDFKIGSSLVEINPFPTHNSTWGIRGSNPTPKTYHKSKSNIASSNGYRCIHIWDWDDVDKIINSFKQKQTVGARNCIIKEVSKNECKEFLNQYHFQNSCNGQTVRLGLYYHDELVEIMTFGKPRYNKKYEWELLRLCTKFGYVISGGANKLIKHFIDEYNPKSIISYCDDSKFNGDVYKQLGFELLRSSNPSRHWWNGKLHITDNFLRQCGFDRLFGTNYGKGTSNDELMIKYGFVEIYDCGQSAWVMV